MRAAIVGAGLMGRWHARELRLAGGIVVGICDVDQAAAERLARAHDGARAFDDLDVMLAEVAPEVVHVCTPPASHVHLAERALRCGAHAIVEKPLAPTADETDQLLAVAESCGRFVVPVHQYLFQDPIRSAGRTLRELQPVLDVGWSACSAGAAGGTDQDADAVAADIVTHPLSVLQRMLPGDLGELEWSASRPRPGELRAWATVAGTSVSITISMGGRPPRHELRVVAAAGTMHADLFHGYAVLEPGAVSRMRKITRPFAFSTATARAAGANLARRTLRREPAYPGLRDLIADVYAFALQGGTPPISHDECRSVARARDRLLRAAGG